MKRSRFVGKVVRLGASAVILVMFLSLVLACGKANLSVAGTPSSAPSNLSATLVGFGQVDLSWRDNSSDESGFRVERSTDNASFVALGTVDAGFTVFSDNTVSANSTYYYRVVAFNTAGDSSPSNVRQVSTRNDNTATPALTPAPSPSPVATSSPTTIPVATSTATSVVAPTLSPVATASPTPIPAATSVATATVAPAPSPVATPFPTAIPADASPSVESPSASATPRPTPTPVPPPVPDSTPAPTATLVSPATVAPPSSNPTPIVVSPTAVGNGAPTDGSVAPGSGAGSTPTPWVPAAASLPRVIITSPVDGATLDKGALIASVSVENFTLAAPGAAGSDGGHLHFYLDTQIPTTPGQPTFSAPDTFKMSADTSVSWENVGPGTHTLGVQLVNADHSPLQPPVMSMVTLTVAARPSDVSAQPTPEALSGPATSGQNFAPGPDAIAEPPIDWGIIGWGIALFAALIGAGLFWKKRHSAASHAGPRK